MRWDQTEFTLIEYVPRSSSFPSRSIQSSQESGDSKEASIDAFLYNNRYYLTLQTVERMLKDLVASNYWDGNLGR